MSNDANNAKLSGNHIVQNQAIGGRGGPGDNGGNGVGGGLHNDAPGVMISGGFIRQNQAVGGSGGSGGNGGDGWGGGVANVRFYADNLVATLNVSNAPVEHNDALGGVGVIGGNGYGGGFYNDVLSTLTLVGATVQFNSAVGGDGSGGSDGDGIGGGVYNLGKFDPDSSVIKKNYATRRTTDNIGPCDWSLIPESSVLGPAPGVDPAGPPRASPWDARGAASCEAEDALGPRASPSKT